VLLGSALAAGVLSLPAHAQSYSDTALSAGAVSPGTFAGTDLKAANDSNLKVIDLSGSGVTAWSVNSAPGGVSPSSTTDGAATLSYTGSSSTASPEVVVDATDSNGNAVALEFTVTLGSNTIQMTTSDKFTTVTVTGIGDIDNSGGTVTFTTTSSGSTFVESNLPTGLTSGNPTLTYVGGTAAPNTYTGVKVTATDTDGAAETGTFTLTVSANTVANYGDEVNEFTNGFDSFRQHDYAGAIIAGWPATQGDPATHFLLNNGSHQGAYQFEYAPNGSGSGLCVSDPGGGWGSDPLRDGLILTPCNSGPFQQFIPQSDGTLVNVATGLIVNPDGKGAQLRGESSAVSWGGASYTWTGETSLP
jgi:hypothetical protein